MGKQFEAGLKQLNDDLLRMGSTVEESIATAMKAFIERKPDLAEKIIAEDETIDHLENHIEDLCLKLLALHQPAATDLRFIIMAIKINSDLERIADLAVNIADRTVEQAGQPHLKPLIDIPRMATLAEKMVHDALDAFLRRDPQLAQDVCARDDEVDNLNDQVFRELLTYMMADPTCIPRAVALLLVARYLERIADHATNIGEEVVYMVQGKSIKHLHPPA
ncbi:MAG: phosphate signaling complex protein PhoU [Planctomycetes bacterium]|nr:phosphate signaling complex protein PhoU [Planctomycetota bacterium]